MIFAIIVTYNAMRCSWIEKCLRSLEASTVPVTPIVIDNGSTDETRQYVPTNFPQAVWLPQEKNLGFGQANNVGLRYALEHDADYVLLLNQDATISVDSIEKMLPQTDNDTILSPLHLNGDGTRLDASFKLCLKASDNTLFDDLLISRQLQSSYSGPTVASGCVIPAACWFMPISIVKTIGGFNPLFFHYSEDVNYAQRINYHKKVFRICPQAVMHHDRQEHGDMHMFYHKRTRRLLLITAVNINLSYSQCLLQWMRILMNCYVSELRQHRYHIGEFISALLWIMRRANKIRKSHIAEKRIGRIWL